MTRRHTRTTQRSAGCDAAALSFTREQSIAAFLVRARRSWRKDTSPLILRASSHEEAEIMSRLMKPAERSRFKITWVDWATLKVKVL